MNKQILLLFGIFAIISIFVWTFTAILVNPTFNFYTNALSALGSPGANYPLIYNIGLMFTSILLLVFSIGLLINSNNKIEEVGSSFLMVSSIFLALIGIFHGGTYPHDFVSVYFFVQAAFSMIIFGIGLLFDNKKQGILTLLIVFIGIGIAELIQSSVSTAIIETFGISVISLWVLIMILFFKKK